MKRRQLNHVHRIDHMVRSGQPSDRSMTSLLASPVTAPQWPHTTAQLVRRANTTRVGNITAPIGISLHQFTELVVDRIDAEATDLHRCTTILTKQVQQTLGNADQFAAIKSLVTDPTRIATADGRTAAELCGESWNPIRLLSSDRACAAIDGARRFGGATVIALAALRTADCDRPWWGTEQWEQRVDAWSSTVRFAPKLKRAVRRTPELIDEDLLAEIIAG